MKIQRSTVALWDCWIPCQLWIRVWRFFQRRLFMTVYLMEKYSGKHIRSTRGVSIFLAFRLHQLSHKHLEKIKTKKLHLFCNDIFLSTTALEIKFSLMWGLKKTTAGNLMGMKIDHGVSQLILTPHWISVASQSVNHESKIYLSMRQYSDPSVFLLFRIRYLLYTWI